MISSLSSPRDSLESSPAPQSKSINTSELSLLYGPTLTSVHDYWKNHSFDYIVGKVIAVLVAQSCPTVCNPWTVAHQAPLSMEFSRQEYSSGLPCPPPGHLPNPGTEPVSLMSPELAGGFFTTSATWKAHNGASSAPKSLGQILQESLKKCFQE